MHHSVIHDKPGMVRAHLWLNLPENPICWLFGHSPRARVQRPGYNIDPWVLVDCRVCGRRHGRPHVGHPAGFFTCSPLLNGCDRVIEHYRS